MSETFVISDTHFGHANIIRLCNRPFSNVEEMDAELVRRWNETVKPDDEVIFGGDFMFAKKGFNNPFFTLNGKKRLIVGNHDHSETLNLPWVSQSTRLEYFKQGVTFVIDHYPIENWNGMYKGSVHLYGHVHNLPMQLIPNRYCMCAEVLDYTPRNIKEFLSTKC